MAWVERCALNNLTASNILQHAIEISAYNQEINLIEALIERIVGAALVAVRKYTQHRY